MSLYFDRISWDYSYFGISSVWSRAHGEIGDAFDYIGYRIRDLIVYNFNRLVETAETLLWIINWQVNPRITALEDNMTDYINWVNMLWDEVYTQLPSQIDALDADIDTLWSEVYVGIPSDLDALDADIDTLWSEVYTYIPSQIDALDADIDTLWDEVYTQLPSQIDALDADIDTLWSEVYTQLPSRIDALESDIRDDMDAWENMLGVRIDDLVINLSDEINRLEGFMLIGLNQLEDDINTWIDDVIATTELRFTGLEGEIESLIAGMESDVFIPLTLLSALLRDDNNIFTDYKNYWQLLISKLIAVL